MCELRAKKEIRIELPLNLIQAIRLIHAIDDSNYKVVVGTKDADKIKHLSRYFPVSITTGMSVAPILKGISVSHVEPATTIGSITKPLVFPHAIFHRCKRMWMRTRAIEYSFAGLLTAQRSETIRTWLERWFPQSAASSIIQRASVSEKKYLPKIIRNILKRKITSYQVGPVLIWFSERGRTFPVKIWDERYYEMLSNSRFVLCPNGDFVWTYRFFEAIMCGAIPIVEEKYRVYEGFRFYTFSDCPTTLQWNLDDAEYNYNRCRQTLTIAREELNHELSRLIQEN